MSNAVKILKQDESSARVGGYGVVFGGSDLVGETFTPDTDFNLDLVPVKLVLYDHAGGRVEHPIGSVKNVDISRDDTGLWIEGEIDKARDYAKQVLRLVEEGVLGWSSGSIAHLTRVANGVIKSWPIVEFSLTPTPAEPRTLGVERIKQLATFDERFAALLPETAGKTVAQDEAADDVDTSLESETMTEQEKPAEVKATPAAPAVDLDPILEAIKGVAAQVETVNGRVDKVAGEVEAVKAHQDRRPANSVGVASGAPTVLQTGRGDSFGQAFKHWIATGDGGGLEIPMGATEYNLLSPQARKASGDVRPVSTRAGAKGIAYKASNPTDMNIGTAADGGDFVPTGFYNQIIARRDEGDLTARLPLLNVPGVGTTVDVPLDNEADGEFVSTAEATAFDQDAPAVSKKSLTLVKYTKYTDISYELLEDTPTNLMAFLADFVGRGLAKTRNNLLITEVGTNGTSFKTFAANSAIAFGEPEDIVGNDDLSGYTDEDNALAWVTRNSTFWDIKSIVGSDRQYAVNADMNDTLLGYPVLTSQKVAAIATTAKSIYFGNWRYVGFREAPGLTFLRNPYTVANSGQLRLHWYFRTVYGVLQAEAIGYGEHPV